MDDTSAILERALEAGFDLAGLAPLEPPPDAARFEAWLAAGHHAGMDWLAASAPRVVDPRGLARGPGTLLVVGLGHAREAVAAPGGGRIARYAAGRDYHNLVVKRLRRLARGLERDGLLAAGAAGRSLADAAPLMERSHAVRAGLGWASKAANLLHPRHGPWFFLGELVLGVDLEALGGGPAPAKALPSCGTCTACLDACPTGAIVGPGQVDAGRCTSYLTIEHRGPVPHALRVEAAEWLYGCDVCSEVCPFGTGAPDRSTLFGTHPAVAEQTLVDWLRLPEGAFRTTLEGSPLQRPRREGIARNAAQALAAHPSEQGRAALLETLERDASPTVRDAALWALARAHRADAGTPAALDRALGRAEGAERAALQETRAAAEDGTS